MSMGSESNSVIAICISLSPDLNEIGGQWVCEDDGTVTLNKDDKRDDDKIRLPVIKISRNIPAIDASGLHVRSHVNESKFHGHGHLNDRYSNHHQRSAPVFPTPFKSVRHGCSRKYNEICPRITMAVALRVDVARLLIRDITRI